VTVFGVVITFLLVFPWALVAVPFVGAAWSAVARSLERSGTGLQNMRGRYTFCRSESRRGEMSLRSKPADDSCVTRYRDSVRRTG
jgi:hypothetical protein